MSISTQAPAIFSILRSTFNPPNSRQLSVSATFTWCLNQGKMINFTWPQIKQLTIEPNYNFVIKETFQTINSCISGLEHQIDIDADIVKIKFEKDKIIFNDVLIIDFNAETLTSIVGAFQSYKRNYIDMYSQLASFLLKLRNPPDMVHRFYQSGFADENYILKYEKIFVPESDISVSEYNRLYGKKEVSDEKFLATMERILHETRKEKPVEEEPVEDFEEEIPQGCFPFLCAPKERYHQRRFRRSRH